MKDAEVILQEVLYRFLKGFSDIRSTERTTSWLFTVARNKITDYFRKKKPEPLSDQLVTGRDEDGTALMLEDILTSFSGDPEDEMMREWIWDAVEEALDEMPEKQRDVFIWNEFEDKSFKDISEMTGEGINTLLSRKRYAIMFLRRSLEDLYHQLYKFNIMKTSGVFYFGRFLFAGLGFLALFTLVIMLLWNGLVPALFSGPLLTYWPALET